MAQKRKNVGLCILLESLCSLRTPKENLEEEVLNACPDMEEKEVDFWVDVLREIGVCREVEEIQALPVYKMAESFDNLHPPKSSLDGFFRKRKILKETDAPRPKKKVKFVENEVILVGNLNVRDNKEKISKPLINRDEEFSGWSL